MPSKSLEDLDPDFRPVAVEFLKHCRAIEPMAVICTLRSEPEQRRAVDSGTSWTAKSKHLPQPPHGLSKAIDICPTRLLVEKNWGPLDPVWWRIGQIAKDLGLRWGGDWKGIGPSAVGITRPQWDPGHVEARDQPIQT